MPIIFRFIVVSLLLILAILSILLWKQSLPTINLGEGGPVTANAYDFGPVAGQIKTDEHVAVLSKEAIQKLVEESDPDWLITSLSLMPEFVQGKFLPHLLDYLDDEYVKTLLNNRQNLISKLAVLMFPAPREELKLRQKFIAKAQEIHTEVLKSKLQNRPDLADPNIYQILPGTSIGNTEIRNDIPNIYQVLLGINVDKIQSDMSRENKLERELEQKKSLVSRLEAKYVDLQKQNNKLEDENEKLEEDLDNLKKHGSKK